MVLVSVLYLQNYKGIIMVLIKDWIIQEQGKHFCQCGCGGEIEIKKHHYSRGVPKYIRGHKRLLPEDDIIGQWVKENQNKHVCICGCGEYIIVKREHYTRGLPEFKHGHQTRGKYNGNWNGGNIMLICEHCGNEYDVVNSYSKDSRFCSQKCFGEYRSENKSVKPTLICEWCGEEYTCPLSQVERSHFCSQECSYNWQSKYQTGENNPRWLGGNVILICEWCGEEYDCQRSRVDNSSFCSYKCSGEWKSKYQTGDNNPHWLGGLSYGKYCILFNNKFKESIRKLYNRRCFLCGKSEEENGRRLDVHHVNYDKSCLCGVVCEFVPLCKSCHSTTNHNRKYWEDTLMNYIYPERYFMVDV